MTKMNPSVKLATMFIVVVAVAAIGTTAATTTTTAFAVLEDDDRSGIELADRLIHEAAPPEEGEQVSDTDIAFHQSLCKVGISTEALDELGGCEALPQDNGDE